MATTFTPSTAHPRRESFAWTVLLMSALGQKRTLESACTMSASRRQTDILNSLLSAMLFPVCNKKFPVPIAGNSPKEVSVLQWICASGEGHFNGNSLYFPGYQGI